ncbi:MAG: purine-nucleoside phosphorylase [Legionellales bacterium]|nr:purine-nucleoside phosphorylase [Legionellales bacterium]|tara:strand:- start:236 stop:1081 length:846 start_codon:yes stop_codon:yes gene_type:complete
MLDLDKLNGSLQSFIKEKIKDFSCKVAIVSGSGQGFIGEKMEVLQSIPFTDIPGFKATGVSGHAGQVLLAKSAGVPVLFFKGRFHWYAGATATQFHAMMQLSQLLGCETVLLTNASGSLNATMHPGELVMIDDHINWQTNPLAGAVFGGKTMFVDMGQPYSKDIQNMLSDSASSSQIKLHTGTYMGVMGPNFETRAEVKLFRQMGADVVGMSTVADVLVARFYQLKVGCVSAVVNFGAGMAADQLSHDLTLDRAQQSSEALQQLLTLFIQKYHSLEAHYAS